MYVNDPVGDMLTRIRNANSRGKDMVSLPASKMTIAIADILLKENFVAAVEVQDTKPQKTLEITLKEGPINLKRVSKPGIRNYVGYRDIRKVKSGLGISVLSTPKGVMTGDKARAETVGGELLFYAW